MLVLASTLGALAALWPLIRHLHARGARRAALLLPLLALPVVATLAFTLAPPPAPPPPANRPLEQHANGYVGSETCRKCHPGEHDSWHASFHRTMTQPCTKATLAPSFERLELDYFGQPVLLEWRGEELWVRLLQRDPQGGPRRQPIERPVVQLTGSHHAQVLWYATGNQRELGVVPMVYRIAEQRWLPFPAVFLVPPEAREPPVPGTWNGNCNGCHTTHSMPRLDTGRVDTMAAEFGIACEACHGPGAAHAAANASPLRRYGLHLGGGGDDTVTEPSHLQPVRSAEVCGQCHSNSIVRRQHFDSWRDEGSPYRPGEVLADSQLVVDPSQANAPELRRELQRDPAFFEHKFWPDGLSRVTGRELHGLLRSPCYGDGDGDGAGEGGHGTMTCLSCHRLHQDRADPRPRAAWAAQQLGAGMDGNAACVQCHPRFADQATVTAHTHHAADSPGSRCYDCHMPHTSYGLLKAVRSHVVDSPDVATELRTGRPNACNLCHLDRTLQWTQEHLRDWYGREPVPLDPDQRDVAAGPRWLLTGDAGQRALAAWHAGWAPAQRAAGTDWLEPFLGQLLQDPYYAVRFVAARSLRSLPGAAVPDGYDELADAARCAEAVTAVQQRWQSRRARASSPARPEILLDERGLRWDTFQRLLARRDDRPVFLAE
ncbi:MAG: multiheme c-type cytochrome [Planctomycetota bacterium]